MTADPHLVAVLATDGVAGFDLAVACQVFGTTRLTDIHPYEVRVCATAPSVASTAGTVDYFRIAAPYRLGDAAAADTVVVPGADRSRRTDDALLDTVRAAAARGARIVSICTGAFVLAEAGLLDGRTVTTHWRAAADLARRHPRVTVDATALYHGEGNIFTSAGAAAGLDLCLHLVGRDHGPAVAAATARTMVVPPSREGGQAQFVAPGRPEPATGSLAPTLEWMLDEAARPLSLREIARHAGLSVRTLTRRFREQTGSSPLVWLLQQRLRLARDLLEHTDLTTAVVAARTGYGSATALRAHFDRELRISPQRYRAAFRSTAPEQGDARARNFGSALPD